MLFVVMKFANGTPKTVWFWQLSGVFLHQAQLSHLHHQSACTPAEVAFFQGLLPMSKPS